MSKVPFLKMGPASMSVTDCCVSPYDLYDLNDLCEMFGVRVGRGDHVQAAKSL